MVAAAGQSTDNFAVDAGYTYFGQFVDHDVTLDDARAAGAGRSPLLDLDSVYGVGPRPGSPLYGSRAGAAARGAPALGGAADGVALAREDLPRDDAGHALVGDPRNDENVIIAQLHLLFIRFHNRVVEHVAATGARPRDPRSSSEARQLVRWHYQWLIVNDFLAKVVGAERSTASLAAGVARGAGDAASSRRRRSASATAWSARTTSSTTGPNVPLFRPRGARRTPARTLAGDRHLPAGLVIDWQHFFRVGDALAAAQQADRRVARRTEFDEMPGMPGVSLALLDLGQGVDDGLPTGTDLTAGTPHALTPDELLGRLGELDDATRRLVVERTPLWLPRALRGRGRAAAGKRLGPVGGADRRRAAGRPAPRRRRVLSDAWRPDWSPAGVLAADFVRTRWPEPSSRRAQGGLTLTLRVRLGRHERP